MNDRDKEIRNLIENLRSPKNYDEAYIGYFQYGGGPTEGFIRANRQGLELHAAELLEASLETENLLGDERKDTFGLDEGISDKESDFFFDYVQLTDMVRNQINPYEYDEETFQDKVIKIGCIGLGLIIIGLTVVGLVKVIDWL